MDENYPIVRRPPPKLHTIPSSTRPEELVLKQEPTVKSTRHNDHVEVQLRGLGHISNPVAHQTRIYRDPESKEKRLKHLPSLPKDSNHKQYQIMTSNQYEKVNKSSIEPMEFDHSTSGDKSNKSGGVDLPGKSNNFDRGYNTVSPRDQDRKVDGPDTTLDFSKRSWVEYSTLLVQQNVELGNSIAALKRSLIQNEDNKDGMTRYSVNNLMSDLLVNSYKSPEKSFIIPEKKDELFKSQTVSIPSQVRASQVRASQVRASQVRASQESNITQKQLAVSEFMKGLQDDVLSESDDPNAEVLNQIQEHLMDIYENVSVAQIAIHHNQANKAQKQEEEDKKRAEEIKRAEQIGKQMEVAQKV